MLLQKNVNNLLLFQNFILGIAYEHFKFLTKNFKNVFYLHEKVQNVFFKTKI